MDAGEGEFGDEELALLKERIAEEAAVAMEKARVKAAAAKRKAQAEALATRQAAKRTKESKMDLDATKAAAGSRRRGQVSNRLRQGARSPTAKAKAEAQLKLAREEMEAAKKALATASTKKTDEKTVKSVKTAKTAPKAASPNLRLRRRLSKLHPRT